MHTCSSKATHASINLSMKHIVDSVYHTALQILILNLKMIFPLRKLQHGTYPRRPSNTCYIFSEIFSYLNPGVMLTRGLLEFSLTSRLLDVHFGRLTWNLQITHLDRKMIFQTCRELCSMLIFRGVVLMAIPKPFMATLQVIVGDSAGQ